MLQGFAHYDDLASPAEALFPGWRGRLPYIARAQATHATLVQAHPGLPHAIIALPFAHFDDAHEHGAADRNYNYVPAEVAALVGTLPETLRTPWLCALLLWHIGRFEEVFPTTGLDREFTLHYADAFHIIIDQIEASPGFAALENDSFLKDLWITRGVMIPSYAQVWWPRSGLGLHIVARGGPRAWRQMRHWGGRRPFLEGHTHDPLVKASYWNQAGWGEALRLAARALPAFPQHHGAFGAAWYFDPVIKSISPRLAYVEDLQVGRGAFRMRIGTNQSAIANATAKSAERKRRYREGTYQPTNFAVIWARDDLIAAYGQ